MSMVCYFEQSGSPFKASLPVLYVLPQGCKLLGINCSISELKIYSLIENSFKNSNSIAYINYQNKI